eukprot:gene16802-19962_t
MCQSRSEEPVEVPATVIEAKEQPERDTLRTAEVGALVPEEQAETDAFVSVGVSVKGAEAKDEAETFVSEGPPANVRNANHQIKTDITALPDAALEGDSCVSLKSLGNSWQPAARLAGFVVNEEKISAIPEVKEPQMYPPTIEQGPEVPQASTGKEAHDAVGKLSSHCTEEDPLLSVTDGNMPESTSHSVAEVKVSSAHLAQVVSAKLSKTRETDKLAPGASLHSATPSRPSDEPSISFPSSPPPVNEADLSSQSFDSEPVAQPKFERSTSEYSFSHLDRLSPVSHFHGVTELTSPSTKPALLATTSDPVSAEAKFNESEAPQTNPLTDLVNSEESSAEGFVPQCRECNALLNLSGPLCPGGPKMLCDQCGLQQYKETHEAFIAEDSSLHTTEMELSTASPDVTSGGVPSAEQSPVSKVKT